MARLEFLTPDAAVTRMTERGVAAAVAQRLVAQHLAAATLRHGEPTGGWRIGADEIDGIRAGAGAAGAMRDDELDAYFADRNAAIREGGFWEPVTSRVQWRPPKRNGRS